MGVQAIVAGYKYNGTKYQSVPIASGKFSGVVNKGSSSGPDMEALPCGAPMETFVNPYFDTEGAIDCCYGALVELKYTNGYKTYGGYIFENFGSRIDGVEDNGASSSSAFCYDSAEAFNLTVVGFYSPNVHAFDEGVEQVSKNGDFFETSSEDWRDFSTGNVVATKEQVQALPENVEFNGWFGGDSYDSIIIGSDDNYYDSDSGIRLFENLPSGKIPVRVAVPASNGNPAIVETNEGDYCNIYGDSILDNLPSDVIPISAPGTDCIEGSDSNYYDLSGDRILQNLPSGVSIVGNSDDGLGNFVGSDGQVYDRKGDVVVPVPPCNGVLLEYNPVVRITIDATDIYGNQVNLGQDITIGVDNIIHAPEGTLIKKINRIIVRNMTTSGSCGFGNMRLFGDIVGAKLGVDIDGVDIDGVLGSFEVASCVFQACNQYADIVYNLSLPLGFTSLSSLDYGYYCMTSDIRLTFEGFDSSEFPYCCPSYDNSEKSGGEYGKTDDKIEISDECICDRLSEIVDVLSSKLQLINDTLSLKFDFLISAINDKELKVENNVSVSPCEPVVQITNPVNNITVSPCEPLVQVTNPVNNINVQSAVPSITVTPCEPTIQNVINQGDVNVDTDKLVEKLDELFKKDDDTITDIVDDVFKTTYQGVDGEMHTEDITEVIRNKQCENVFECIVEPVNMAYEGKGKYIDKDILEQN